VADQDARRLLDGFNPLPPHPRIHHQGHAILELHYGPGRDGSALDHIQVKAIMQRNDLALHARGDHSGLAFHLDSFILPDDEVADLEVEGSFCQGSIPAALSQASLAVAINPLHA